MIREVDLVSYLPPFLSGYKEINAALTAENPEFRLVWQAADRVLKNEFIQTADEYGISRFEKILNIFPSKDDTLESRRARVQARWFMTLPYTWRMFLEKLITICGDSDFLLTKQFDYYRIDLTVHLELFGQVEELEKLVETMLPCNIVMAAKNEMPMEADGVALAIGGICKSKFFFITNDETVEKEAIGVANIAGHSTKSAVHFITNDSEEQIQVTGPIVHKAGAIGAVSVILTNDFSEQFEATGISKAKAGIVAAETIEINE